VDAVAGNYAMQASRILWGSQHPDREYSVVHSSNSAPPPELSVNITRTINEDLDAALDQGRTTDDTDEQIAAWAGAQTALAQENTFIFLVHNDIGEVAWDRVRDVDVWSFPDGTTGRPQEQTLISLYQIWLER
jgi:ABC-type transport system substrate-binding protein